MEKHDWVGVDLSTFMPLDICTYRVVVPLKQHGNKLAPTY